MPNKGNEWPRMDRTWIDKIPERLKQPLSRASTFSATQINSVFRSALDVSQSCAQPGELRKCILLNTTKEIVAELAPRGPARRILQCQLAFSWCESAVRSGDAVLSPKLQN
jgi:hypothetical protein